MSDKTGQGPDEAERKYKVWLRAETAALFVVIVIVWSLLLLPVVIYFLPVEIHYNNTTSNDTLRQASTCRAPIVYTGTVCQEELLSLRSCYIGDADSYPVVATDYYLKDAELALHYVDLLTTPECKSEVKPFLCHYFFGLCDLNTKISYHPSSSQCRNLRDRVCKREWNIATNLGQLELPNCDRDFLSKSVLCRDTTKDRDDTGTFFSTSDSNVFLTTVEQLSTSAEHLEGLVCSNITCREGFYCVDDVGCNPSCASWKQYPHSTNTAITSLLLISTSIGVVFGVGVLAIAGLRWKRVLTFPSSFAVYQTITALVSALFVLVSYIDNNTLYCTSENLYLSLSQSTSFCILTGAMFYYCSFQFTMFWLCHVLIIFWELKFPFHARSFQITHRTRYVHIACVAVSILFPVVPVAATMIEYSHGKSFGEAAKGGFGFVIVHFPPILCHGRNKDLVFYSFILPIVIILMVGITVLIFIFWIIHKQHGLFRARQSKNPHKIGTAERKILIVFVYYVLLTVFAVLAFSLATRDADRFTTEVMHYFECERKGVDPYNSCDTSGYDNIPIVIIASLSYILSGMYPLTNFIYIIDIRELKQCLRKWFPYLFERALQKTAGYRVQTSSSGNATGMLMLTNHPQEV